MLKILYRTIKILIRRSVCSHHAQPIFHETMYEVIIKTKSKSTGVSFPKYTILPSNQTVKNVFW